MPVRSDTSEVQAPIGHVHPQGLAERLAERRRPFALEGEEAAKDRDERLGGIDPLRIRDRQAGTAKAPDARDFLLGVVYESGVYRLLRLEHGVDALRRDDGLALIVE